MNDEPTLITRLEAQIAELHHDWKIAQAISKNTNPTAIGEYIALREDIRIVLGIRYVSLSAVTEEYQLYQDNREIYQLKDLIAKEIDLPSHVDTLYSIHTVRTKYSKVYELNYRAFDRYERLVKEMTRDLNEWGTKIFVVPNEDRNTNRTSRYDILDVNPAFKENIQSIDRTQDSNVFTEEQVKTLLESERSGNIKVFIVLATVAIISGVIGISIATKQQPPLIDTNGQPTPSQTALSNPSPQISREEAESIVQRWLIAKKTLFAPPFDRATAADLATDKAYIDKVKGPGSDGTPYSASEWLQTYGYYYNYGVQRIDSIDSFEASGNTAVIEVRVTEDSNLYNSKGEVQVDKSGLEYKSIKYNLVRKNGMLKISDYNTLGKSKRKL
jgi:ARC6-like, IMS domain